MKKKAIIAISVISAFIVALGCFYFANSSHDTSSSIVYKKNKKILNTYINNCLPLDSDSEIELPVELENIGISDIKYYNNCVFLLVKTKGFVFGGALYGIYYSFDGEYSEDTPYYCDIDENSIPAKINNKGYLFGNKENDEWYYTENLDGSWYSFEVHSS